MSSSGEVVVFAPLLAAAPVPKAAAVWSTGLDLATPEYSATYIWNQLPDVPLRVTVTVIAPAPPVMLLA